MNRLNKTQSAVFLYCRFSLFLMDPFFPIYLEVAIAVVMLHGVGKTSHCTSIKSSYFFHILVLQEYWVLMESRMPLKPVLGDERIVALSINSH